MSTTFPLVSQVAASIAVGTSSSRRSASVTEALRSIARVRVASTPKDGGMWRDCNECSGSRIRTCWHHRQLEH
uniref:Uncharacterized protein n=1 Tax=Hyaloperonospora arabidopsidis (strain Emoy2) TaxID=559515 RepID=M4BEY5_HYAAE